MCGTIHSPFGSRPIKNFEWNTLFKKFAFAGGVVVAVAVLSATGGAAAATAARIACWPSMIFHPACPGVSLCPLYCQNMKFNLNFTVNYYCH